MSEAKHMPGPWFADMVPELLAALDQLIEAYIDIGDDCYECETRITRCTLCRAKEVIAKAENKMKADYFLDRPTPKASKPQGDRPRTEGEGMMAATIIDKRHPELVSMRSAKTGEYFYSGGIYFQVIECPGDEPDPCAERLLLNVLTGCACRVEDQSKRFLEPVDVDLTVKTKR